MIRILHIVTSMDAGGIETMLMNLYRNIDRSKIQFDFLVHRDHKAFYEDEILSLGGKIHRMIPINMKNLYKYNKMLKVFFSTHQEYKIIHSHISILSSIVLWIAKNNNVDIRISHSHESHKSFKEYRVKRIPAIIICKLLINNQVTYRFACSKAAGQWLYGDKADFRIINNAIDAQLYKFCMKKRVDKRREMRVDDKFIIGHIGNFSNAKNYPFILNVFKLIIEQNSQAILMLVGKNQSNPEIEEKVKEMGLEDFVIFTGVRSDIPELLHAMDVFLFPSLYEGLPVTLIEAQASGLKCFASDTITEEVKITNELEFISLNNSPKYWADKILKYIYGYDRKNNFQKICEAGYDIKGNAKLLQKFYLEEYAKVSSK